MRKTRITLEIVWNEEELDDPILWDYGILFDLGAGESVEVIGGETVIPQGLKFKEGA